MKLTSNEIGLMEHLYSGGDFTAAVVFYAQQHSVQRAAIFVSSAWRTRTEVTEQIINQYMEYYWETQDND